MSSLVPLHPFQLPAGWNLTRPNNTCNNVLCFEQDLAPRRFWAEAVNNTCYVSNRIYL
jgi:hypothetical protein